MAFGLGGLLGGGRVPDVEMPDGLPVTGGGGSPLVDAFLALQARRIKDAATAPRDALSGDLQVMGPDGHPTAEAIDRAAGLAGLAMAGSMPFSAPSGSLRAFGGRAADPESMLGRLSAGLDQEAALRPRRDPFGALSRPAQAGPDPVAGLEAALKRELARPNAPVAADPTDPVAALEAALAKSTTAPSPAAAPMREPYAPPSAPAPTRAPAEPPTALETRVLRASRDVQGDGFKGDIWDVRPRLDNVPEPDFRDALLGLQRKGYATLSQYSDPKAIRGKVGIDIGGDDPRHIVMLRPEGRAAIEGLPVQDLYSGGPAGAVGVPALTSSSDPKGTPVSAGLGAPSMLDGLSPEMQAQILRALQTPQPGSPEVPDATFRGFQPPTPPTGAPTPVVHGSFGGPAPEERRAPARPLLADALGGAPSMLGGQMPAPAMPPAAEAPARAPARIPTLLGIQPPDMPAEARGPASTGSLSRGPARSPSAPAAADRDPPSAAPGLAPRNIPLPPARPAEFAQADDARPANDFDPLTGQVVAGKPTPIAPAPAVQGASAAAGAPATPGGFDLRGMLGKMNSSGLSDQLIAIGAGLLSGKSFGEGLGRGLENAQRASALTATTNLAQAKAAREQLALSGNMAVLKRAYPNMTDAELAGMAGNSANVSTALQILRDPTHGMPETPERIAEKARAQAAGSMEGGAKPLDRIQDEARAQAAGAAAGKPDETFTTLSEADRIERGLPPGAYQVDSKNKVSPINPSGTTINMGAEKMQDATVGKAYGEYQNELATKGRNAANTLNSLALMEQAMKTPGFYSGVGGEGVKRANQFLAALGVKDPRAASAAEVFDALSNKVVLDGLGGSLGPGISNTDRDYIARTAPTLAQSQQGNADLIGVARALAQRQQQVAKLGRDYAAANNGRLDSGFDQKLEEYAAANPLFPQARDTATASAPKEAPQGAPAGARQASDGKWYVADPARPGKYLQVR